MSTNWLNKILSHQVTPPEGVWVNITNELDKENETAATDFKTKMLAFETTAPDKVLVNIFNTLDEEEKQSSTSFAERLYNYNAEAPADAWKNIASELDKSETKIVPLQNNKKNQKVIYFRMAAAASVIAIIATTIWLSSNTKDDAINSTASSVTPQSQQPNTPVAGTEKTTLPASDTQEKKLAKEQTAYNPAKKTTPAQTQEAFVADYVKGNKGEDLAQDPAIGNKEKLQTANGETPMDIALMNTPNTYISITGPDGQTIKVSSKFSNLIGYLTDKNPELQENLDVIIKESAKWKNTFAIWRDKMTNNVVAPSLSNFMDIMELSNVLEEKK
ncbi:hypothetical protein [Ferruginibacter sp.]